MVNSKKTAAAWTVLFLLLINASFYTTKSILKANSKMSSLVNSSKQKSVWAAKSYQNSDARVDTLSDKTEEQALKQLHAKNQPDSTPEIIKYTVKSGDTINSIAKQYGLNTSSITISNVLSESSVLKDGQQLVFPSIDGIIYTVKSGETLWNICAAYSIDISSITDANKISASSLLKIGQELILPGIDSLKTVNTKKDAKSSGSIKIASRGLSVSSFKCIWPVKGHVTSGFGPRDGEFHKGIDICAPTGTNIFAAMDGKVLSSGWNDGGYGNLIIIQHSNGIKTVYGHCSKLSVSAGQNVSLGQKIGEVGMTGDATAPHCHFEIRISDNPVNPLEYIQ